MTDLPDKMKEAVELLPCPFCCGDVHVIEDRGDNGCEPLLYRPQCKRCGADRGGLHYRDGAISAWNTRAALHPRVSLDREGVATDLKAIAAELRSEADKWCGTGARAPMSSAANRIDQIIALLGLSRSQPSFVAPSAEVERE